VLHCGPVSELQTRNEPYRSVVACEAENHISTGLLFSRIVSMTGVIAGETQ
jgi:hypothetical protein